MSRVLIGSISSLMPASSSLLGRERQVLDEDVLQHGAVDALRRDAGQAIDLLAAERLAHR